MSDNDLAHRIVQLATSNNATRYAVAHGGVGDAQRVHFKPGGREMLVRISNSFSNALIVSLIDGRWDHAAEYLAYLGVLTSQSVFVDCGCESACDLIESLLHDLKCGLPLPGQDERVFINELWKAIDAGQFRPVAYVIRSFCDPPTRSTR